MSAAWDVVPTTAWPHTAETESREHNLRYDTPSLEGGLGWVTNGCQVVAEPPEKPGNSSVGSAPSASAAGMAKLDALSVKNPAEGDNGLGSPVATRGGP